MDRIAIVIPTMNRAAFLNRALNYYRNIKFTGTIYIVDSSAEKQEYNFKDLNIVYKKYPKYPNTNEIMAWQYIMGWVKEPYAIFSGDDDFIIAHNLIPLADFLDKNLDYTLASGLQLRFNIEGENEVVGRIKLGSILKPHNWHYDNPVDRFCGYMRHGGSISYFLHRKAIMDYALQYCTVVTLPAIGTEIILGCLAVLSGKVKPFPIITSLQQEETNVTIFPRNKYKENAIPTFFQIITDPQWPEQFRLFSDIAIQEMVRLTGITKEEASIIFHREFVHRVITLLDEQHQQNYVNFTREYRTYWSSQTLYTKYLSCTLKDIEKATKGLLCHIT
jgi:glycosyltransferase domain-containing protein